MSRRTLLAPSLAPTASTARAARLEARALSCGNQGRVVLSGVDLSVEPGESLALVGPNGSGKSTLIRALAGVSPAMAGRIMVNGQELSTMPSAERGRTIAVVSQDERPSGDLRIAELVELGLVPHRNPWSRPRREDRDTVLEALDRVGLRALADRPVSRTSGGELRRAILARGLVQGAPLLFLDEPTNHLDVHQQLSLLDLVRGLHRTVIAAVHDLDLAAAYFDRAALIDGGRLLELGEAQQVVTGEASAHCFHVDITPVENPRTGDTHLLMGSPQNPRPPQHH
ncbi:iron complex transport system ATP-binding protein [Propionibacterium cyclohexanicum]|uniref:Iron complex transport system ATP-binding protein n=1 Tax=Propionibacterium cyclohexanicum TaxID=64702 RepID=A0A1H9RXG8_9ACTN|nr:ABC transporter ATP-binding protein [Propionibacterium cyclohexanicum]SER77500.1 iron complex transport system ATP-binding protein [Propionibacterium cyclohexanicum]